MTNRRLLPIANTLLIVVLGGCAAETLDEYAEEGPVDEAYQEIVNGTPTSGFESVVEVRPFQDPVGEPFEPCTGTLISRRTVLTAAHCVYRSSGQLRPKMEVRVPVRACPNCALSYQWRQGTPIPHYNYHDSPNVNFIETFDVALINLAEETLYVQYSRVPGPAASTPSTFAGIGDPLTIVGFGLTSGGAQYDGVKRTGYNSIETINNNHFYLKGTTSGEALPCSGDSGGPAFNNASPQCILGVVKGGSETCPMSSLSAQAVYTRLDTNSIGTWIDQNAAVKPSPCICDPKAGTHGTMWISETTEAQFAYVNEWCSIGTMWPEMCWGGTYYYQQFLNGSYCYSSGNNSSCYDPDDWWVVTCDSIVDCVYDCSGKCRRTQCYN